MNIYCYRLLISSLKFIKMESCYNEKLCLQWNDFHDNIRASFKELREDKDFTDVTLACEDGQHIQPLLPEPFEEEQAQSPLDLHEGCQV